MSVLTPKTAGYVNLSYCVAQVLADLQDYSDRHIERFTQWAIRAYTDANLFNSVNVEVVYLEPDDNGIIDISGLTDYVDYVKVGMPVNGKIWVLSKNTKILPRRDELDADQEALIFSSQSYDLDVGSSYTFADHYVNGAFCSGLFGLGGGFSRSYFNIDLEKMQIQLDTALPRNQIILEYISTGVKASGATLIPRSAVEYVIAYIHWQNKQHDPMVDRFTKREYKQEYLERENMMREFNLRFNLEEYLTSTYSTYKQGIKM